MRENRHTTRMVILIAVLGVCAIAAGGIIYAVRSTPRPAAVVSLLAGQVAERAIQATPGHPASQATSGWQPLIGSWKQQVQRLLASWAGATAGHPIGQVAQGWAQVVGLLRYRASIAAMAGFQATSVWHRLQQLVGRLEASIVRSNPAAASWSPLGQGLARYAMAVADRLGVQEARFSRSLLRPLQELRACLAAGRPQGWWSSTWHRLLSCLERPRAGGTQP